MLRSDGVYRITNVGVYYVAHFNAAMYKIELGQPHTCLSTTFKLISDFPKQLFNICGVDAEDGLFLSSLNGHDIWVSFDEDGRISAFEDVFRQKSFAIDDSMRAL